MIDEPNVYKMKRGHSIGDLDRSVEEIAADYFEDDPIVKDYDAHVYETEGNKKNHLYFEYNFIDLDRVIEEFDPEQHEETNKRINEFLYEVTKRTAKNRRDSMKRQAKKK